MAGDPVDGRRDRRIVEVDARGAYLRLGQCHAGAAALQHREGLVALAPADRAVLVERGDARPAPLRLAQERLLVLQARLGLLQGDFERLWVDAEQHLAGLDPLPFDIGPFEQDAADPPTPPDLAPSAGAARLLARQRPLPRRAPHDAHPRTR